MRARMSRLLLAGVALGVAVLAAPGSRGQLAEHPVLLALAKTDHTLSIVDPVTLKVIAKMPVGRIPTKSSRQQMERARGSPIC